MNSLSKSSGTSTTGMLTSLAVFVGVIAYAKYYAFAPSVETIVPAAATSPVVELQASQDSAPITENLASGADAASTAEVSLEQVAQNNTQQSEGSVSASFDAASETLTQSTTAAFQSQEAGELNAQQPVAQLSSFEVPVQSDERSIDGAAQFNHGASADQAYAQQFWAAQANRYYQKSKAASAGDAEFTFAMSFKGRSRVDADADANSDWSADHSARAAQAAAMDQTYRPAFRYYGYNY